MGQGREERIDGLPGKTSKWLHSQLPARSPEHVIHSEESQREACSIMAQMGLVLLSAQSLRL